MKKRSIFGIMIISVTLLFAIASILFLSKNSLFQTFHSTEEGGYVVVLDPGHGGIDGGAVSKNGLVEQEITLKIAQKAKEYLELSGVRVVMTRADGGSIHDAEKKTVKEQKMSDLKNRAAVGAKEPTALFVSIHLNSFPDVSQCGAQVFYKGESDSSRQLGEVTQKTMVEVLNKENRRVAKEIPSTIYLMRKIENTAMLVECGFLSNETEAQLLSTEAYQERVAFGIYVSVLRYIGEQE